MSGFYNNSFSINSVNLHFRVKKLFVIPLLFLYLVATTGIIIHLHYCGEQIESWALNDKADGCEDGPCDETDTQEHDCCKDKAVSSKMSVEQDVVSFFKLSFSQKFILPVPDYFSYENDRLICFCHAHGSFHAHAPPGNRQFIPLYKLHSSLTYYG